MQNLPAGKMAITFAGAMQRASLRCVPGVERAMLVGTPPKLLEMARWNGWDTKCGEGEEARWRKWVWDGLRSACLTTSGWSSKKRTFVSVRIYALIWSVSDARNRPRLYRSDAAPAERRSRCARQTGPRYQLRRARLQDSSITARLPIQLHPHLRDDPRSALSGNWTPTTRKRCDLSRHASTACQRTSHSNSRPTLQATATRRYSRS